jgi:hypothetical protein
MLNTDDVEYEQVAHRSAANAVAMGAQLFAGIGYLRQLDVTEMHVDRLQQLKQVADHRIGSDHSSDVSFDCIHY